MIIVDASVAVTWVVEATDALCATALRGQLTPDEAQGQAADLADAPVASVRLPGLLPAAMRLALELRHPIYDCFFLAAAMQRDTYVATADRRFAEKAAAHAQGTDRIRLLGR